MGNLTIKQTPICACCGGPRSIYSAAWCRDCYRKDTRPTQFKPVAPGINYEQLEIVLLEIRARDERYNRKESLRRQVEINRRVRLDRRIQAYQDSVTRARLRHEGAIARVMDLDRYRAERLDLRIRTKAARDTAKARNSAPTLASMAYPYIRSATEEYSDLMLVNSIVPRSVEGREDICQEIMIALWESRISIGDLRANKRLIREFVMAFRRDNLEGRGYAVSLDSPRADGRSWHDFLIAPSSE